MFPGPEALAIEVEFYCAAHRVCGKVRLPNENYRLTDFLNTAEESVHLTHVSIFSLDGAVQDEIGELTLEKRTVRLALPRETPDFLSRRRLTRAGMVRPDFKPVPALILLPPYTVKGLIFAGAVADHGRIERGRLARFASLTAASLHQDGRLLLEDTFMAISRDAIAAIGRGATSPDATTPRQPRPSARGPFSPFPGISRPADFLLLGLNTKNCFSARPPTRGSDSRRSFYAAISSAREGRVW